MAFIGTLGEDYRYLVDKNGSIWSINGRTYYGNIKNIPGLHPVGSSTSQYSFSGLGGLGSVPSPAIRAAQQKKAAEAKAKVAAVIKNLTDFYAQNSADILSKLPPSTSGQAWSLAPGQSVNAGPLGFGIRYGSKLLGTGFQADIYFLDSGAQSYYPQKPPTPPHMQAVKGTPGPTFSTLSYTAPFTHMVPSPAGAGMQSVTEPLTVTIGYQTGWSAWPGFRRALHGWGLVEHAIAYALPAIAVVAAPFVLPVAIAAGGAAGGAGGGILTTIEAALPSLTTIEEAAGGISTAFGVAQKVTQAQAAKKQAAQQMAQAQQAEAQITQAQAAQDIAQEVQSTVAAGYPITQDLVNRAAKAGIKLSPTGAMAPMEASLIPGIPAGKLPYLIGGIAFLGIMYYLFSERK